MTRGSLAEALATANLLVNVAVLHKLDLCKLIYYRVQKASRFFMRLDLAEF